MINALEKVVYPNGKTQSLAEIGGAVEGLSALIDEVDKNTSAISSITSQISALVADVDTNTSAITSINNKIAALAQSVVFSTTVNISANSSLDINLSQIIPQGTHAYHVDGALARYELPRFNATTGEISVYIDTIFQDVLTLKNRSNEDWTNTPAKFIIYYA